MAWGRRGRRARIDSGMPSGGAQSEKRAREGWYIDRLRRSRKAMEEALGEIDDLKGSEVDADTLLAAMGRVANVLRVALDAEKRDGTP